MSPSSVGTRAARFSLALIAMAGFVAGGGAGCSRNSADADGPPSACELTLLGCDADGNGVRDDVQRQVEQKYPLSQRSREALFQDARALQHYLSDDATDSGPRTAQQAVDAVDCMDHVLGLDEAGAAIKWMRRIMFNRADRLEGYIQRSGKGLGGAVFAQHNELKEACTFDPDGFSK